MISPRSTKKSLKTSNVTERRRARMIELLPQLTFQTGELTFELPSMRRRPSDGREPPAVPRYGAVEGQHHQLISGIPTVAAGYSCRRTARFPPRIV
jgi:hypothetical protein